MKIFTGTTWNKIKIQQSIDLDIGWCSSPQDPVQPEKIPHDIQFIYDNGAFNSYKNQKPFDSDLFYKRLNEITRTPFFVVVPDIVGGGMDSFNFSMSHIDKIPFKKYFVIQPGMSFEKIYPGLSKCDGGFIGGYIGPADWSTWIDKIHEIGLPCHIGKCCRLEWYFIAYDLGADSVDGSYIMRHDKLKRVKEFRELLHGRQFFDYRYINLSKSVVPDD
jgi:hypothetical protein